MSIPDSLRIEEARSQNGRYLTLNHWRGIACLLLVIHHATIVRCDQVRISQFSAVATTVNVPLDSSVKSRDRTPLTVASRSMIWMTGQMHVGVEMFFVISGYCIAASAVSLRYSGRSVFEYFRRRFVRIFPTYWFALLLLVCARFVIDGYFPGILRSPRWPLTIPQDLSVTQWIASLTLTGSWLGYFTGEPRACFPPHAWTLCHEEQFYAVVGAVLAFGGRYFFRAVAIITLMIAALNPIAIMQEVPIEGFFFDQHWFMFAAGVGIYWCLNHATPRQSQAFQCALSCLAIGLAILALTTTIFGNHAHFSGWRVSAALGFACLLGLLKKYDQKLARMSGTKWLQSCGEMSYSIYLVHLLPCKLISEAMLRMGFDDDFSTLLICVPLALVTSIMLGFAFHIAIERRFHRPIRPLPHDGTAARQPVGPSPASLSGSKAA